MSESLREIRLFVAVYEEHSFTAAAARENVTQSGVSQHIRKLEDRLGMKLFSRGAGSVTKTPAGDAYYHACIEVLRAHAQANRKVERFAKGFHGEIVVGLMPTMTRSSLAPALAQFIEAHPNVAVRVIEAYSGELTKQVRAGELEFAVVPGLVDEVGVRCTSFGQTPQLLVSSTRSKLQHYAPVRLADLGPLNIVVPGTRNVRRAQIEAYLATNGVKVARRLELDTMFGTLDFVAKTDWVTILPGMMMLSEFDRGQLTINPLVEPAFTLNLVLMEPSRRPMSQAARALLDALRASTNSLNEQLSTRVSTAASLRGKRDRPARAASLRRRTRGR